MHRLSMIQALSLWSDLEDALNDNHGYGGDVAEIYVHRIMQRSPTVEAALDPTGLFRAEAQAALRAANESFHNLLVHFAKEREAIIEIETHAKGVTEFVELGAWLKSWEGGHRWHVRVRRRNPSKPIDDGDLLHPSEDRGEVCGTAEVLVYGTWMQATEVRHLGADVYRVQVGDEHLTVRSHRLRYR